MGSALFPEEMDFQSFYCMEFVHRSGFCEYGNSGTGAGGMNRCFGDTGHLCGVWGVYKISSGRGIPMAMINRSRFSSLFRQMVFILHAQITFFLSNYIENCFICHHEILRASVVHHLAPCRLGLDRPGLHHSDSVPGGVPCSCKFESLEGLVGCVADDVDSARARMARMTGAPAPLLLSPSKCPKLVLVSWFADCL